MTNDVDVVVTPVALRGRYSSNSEVATFKRCRRKWWLTYSLKLRPTAGEVTEGALWIGTLVHIGHDTRFKALKAGYTDAQSIKLSDRAIISHVHRAFKRGVQVDYKDVELARIMLSGFWEWEAEEGLLDEYEVLDTEREMITTITLDDGTIIFYLGKADVLARNRMTRFLWIIDKKTVGSLLDPTFGLQRNEQMLGYLMLLESNPLDSAEFGDDVYPRPEGAMFSMLRKVKRTATAKPPFYGRAEVRYNQTERRNYEQRLRFALDDIVALERKVAPYNVPGLISQAAQIAYPTPTPDCSWDCKEFVNICDSFNDGSRIEDLLIEHYEPLDPLARYERAPHEEQQHPVGEMPHGDEG